MSKKKSIIDWNELTKDNGTFFVAILIVLPLLFLVAGFIFNLCFAAWWQHHSAKYHVEVLATVTDITKKEYEKYELSAYNREEWKKITNRIDRDRYYEQHKELVKHTKYKITWQYCIDGDTLTDVETDSEFTFKEVGDTKMRKMFSLDGKKYMEDSSSLSFFVIVIGFLAGLFCLYIIYIFVGVIYTKIKSIIKNE